MEGIIIESECKIKQTDLEFPQNNEIGRGAFGKVLLAVVKGTGEKVAIKKFSKIEDIKIENYR